MIALQQVLPASYIVRTISGQFTFHPVSRAVEVPFHHVICDKPRNRA